MVVTYKNNRTVPALIITLCVGLFFYLLNPATERPDQQRFQPTLEDETQPARPSDVTIETETPHFSSPATATETAVPTKSKTEQATSASQSSGDGASLARNDVLLIMKTGGTTMWKRLLVHLTTTLIDQNGSLNNTVIYSDYSETIGDFKLIDVLSNMTDSAKSMPDFDVYRELPEYMANNYYPEAAGVAGDEWGPTGGWIIDKYKFVPLMEHAGANWPAAKWYIYMEDDTYLFMPNVLAYLSRFDWREPHYLGSYAAKSDVVFAHGGAGFALSRGAWEKSFGRNANMTGDYYQYAADHCCGDQVLAHALKDYGVEFGENGGDGKFTWGFNPLVHWNFAFSRHNWCSPLLSWHKVHNRDVSRYYEIEKQWDFTKPMLHGDFFREMILASVQKPIQWWDNMASLYEVTSANKEAPPAPEGEYDANLWKNAWESTKACEAACRGWKQCVEWTYVEDLCKMDDKMIMGQGFAPAMSQRKTSLMHTSGWVPERLEQWAC